MENYQEILDAKKILDKYDPKDMTENRGSQDHIPQKWRDHFSRGWYGFDMGWAPDNWFKIIDEFLDALKKLDPKFEIHQIKIKFGGIRIYLSFSEDLDKDIRKHINEELWLLECEMQDNSLIY